MQEKLRVGTVVTTHGLKGEVKVYPTTEDPDRFFDLDKVWLDLSGSMENLRELHVERVRFSKNLAIVKFEGIDSIDDVLPFRHGELLVDCLLQLHTLAEACPEHLHGEVSLQGIRFLLQKAERIDRQL